MELGWPDRADDREHRAGGLPVTVRVPNHARQAAVFAVIFVAIELPACD